MENITTSRTYVNNKFGNKHFAKCEYSEVYLLYLMDPFMYAQNIEEFNKE